MILDDNDESDRADAEDEAEDASGHVDAGASLQNTLATSELASGRASQLIHTIHGMILRRAVGSTSLLRVLGISRQP
jgi:hypothetical protein